MSDIKSKDMAVANGAPEPDGLANATRKDEREADALASKLQANEDMGARVMEFDEEASPEQKAAQAKKKMNEIRPPKADKEGGSVGEYGPRDAHGHRHCRQLMHHTPSLQRQAWLRTLAVSRFVLR